MNVLITGGAGYIGTVLTETLLQRADVEKVYVLDNLMYRQDNVMPFCFNPKYEFVLFEIKLMLNLTKLMLLIRLLKFYCPFGAYCVEV